MVPRTGKPGDQLGGKYMITTVSSIIRRKGVQPLRTVVRGILDTPVMTKTFKPTGGVSNPYFGKKLVEEAKPERVNPLLP